MSGGDPGALVTGSIFGFGVGEACALGAAAVWSTSIVLFRRSEALSAQGINLFKNVSASLLLLATMPVLHLSFAGSRSGGDWLRLVVSGVLGIAIADTMIFSALRRLGAARLAVVETAYTPTIVGLSVLFLDESVGPGFLVGGLLVVAGVLFAQERGAVRGGGGGSGPDAKGVMLGLGGMVAMAVGVVLAKPVLASGHLVEVTLVRLLAGVSGQAVWMALVPSERSALEALKPNRTWWTLAPASFLGAYVAMLLWLGGFKWTGASTASVLNQMSTVFTIALARVWLGEPVTRARLMGAAMAVVGAILVIIT
ncbi:MAG: DMT family transporter [Myxococcota bacterium]